MKWIIAISILALAFTCHGKPQNIPIEAVISNSDLIVMATLTDIKRQETNKLVRCEGALQVEEILKGPNVKAVTVEWFVSSPPMEDEADHAWATGKRILWLLKQAGANTYEANYYKRVQDVKQKDEIKKMIKKAPNQASESSVAPAPQIQR